MSVEAIPKVESSRRGLEESPAMPQKSGRRVAANFGEKPFFIHA